jgi:hypothetical protein
MTLYSWGLSDRLSAAAGRRNQAGPRAAGTGCPPRSQKFTSEILIFIKTGQLQFPCRLDADRSALTTAAGCFIGTPLAATVITGATLFAAGSEGFWTSLMAGGLEAGSAGSFLYRTR